MTCSVSDIFQLLQEAGPENIRQVLFRRTVAFSPEQHVFQVFEEGNLMPEKGQLWCIVIVERDCSTGLRSKISRDSEIVNTIDQTWSVRLGQELKRKMSFYDLFLLSSNFYRKPFLKILSKSPCSDVQSLEQHVFQVFGSRKLDARGERPISLLMSYYVIWASNIANFVQLLTKRFSVFLCNTSISIS